MRHGELRGSRRKLALAILMAGMMLPAVSLGPSEAEAGDLRIEDFRIILEWRRHHRCPPRHHREYRRDERHFSRHGEGYWHDGPCRGHRPPHGGPRHGPRRS